MTPYGFLKAAAMNNATMRAQTIGGQKYSRPSFQFIYPPTDARSRARS
jgi:hypothetical protein